MAKYAERYIHKGDKLYIEGRIRYRDYDDKKGIRHSVTEVYADSLEWLSAPKKANAVNTSKEQEETSSEDDSKLPF